MFRNLFTVCYLALSTIIAATAIWELQLSEPLFTSAWLKPALFPEWDDKILFFSMMLVYSLASAGVLMLVGTRILAMFRLRPLTRLISILFFILGLVAIDAVVRLRIAAVMGNHFSLDTAFAGVESTEQLFSYIWSWYSGDLLFCMYIIGASLLLNIATVFVLKGKFSIVQDEPLPAKSFFSIFVISTVISLLMVTVFVTTWPKALNQISQTSAGFPFVEFCGRVTDFDGDGWGYFDIPPDTKPFEKKCKPFAIDYPNNGIDENLLGGDFLLPQQMEPGIPVVELKRQPNLIVVFMESVRFDSFRRQINGRPVTPFFRKLLRDGALAPQHAFATQGYTSASVKQFAFGGFQTKGETVLDEFKQYGYQTALFFGYDLKEEKFDTFLKADYIFDSGKNTKGKKKLNSTPAYRLVHQIDSYLEERDKQQPFFIFSFFVDPHFPYKQFNPPVLCERHIPTDEIRPENKEQVINSYYDQVHHVDRASAQLMDVLKKHKIDKSTVVVFVSDHGEALYDDGMTIGHGIDINDAMTHLAMLVVNSPIDIPDVLSHHHIRGLLRDMVTLPKVSAPQTREMPRRRLLQYIGNLRYPSKIATYSSDEGRIIYDMKKSELTTPQHIVTDLDALDADSIYFERGRLLIQTWEFAVYSAYHKHTPMQLELVEDCGTTVNTGDVFWNVQIM
ncbi:MAG: sulfatase-like hydrolase/transferase [Deltaproteobacteria bacterium]|nr:sulfatase-like hydrolase/transferase [Deltaproteobacteria bacterium]MBN2674830.1 sulfatase-like hydrolase/transferase [Deltaproteobacteria bacterium]